jgi:hypothetical protein
MKPLRHKQQGVVLVVSLLMITVLALLAAASINLTSNGILIAANNQTEQTTTDAANMLVEQTLSSLPVFTDPIDLAPELRNGVTVQRSAPECVQRVKLPGFSLTFTQAPQHNYYQFQVTASDVAGGASTTLDTGVRILLNDGTCS